MNIYQNDIKGEKMSSFIFIDFTFNITNGSNNWDDYFSTPLLQQYSNIYKKMGNTVSPTINDFRRFINVCFSTYIENSYFLSMPAYDRKCDTDRKGYNVYRNIVIRPKKTNLIEPYLPKGQNVILIGDIKVAKVTTFVVKGIETIDETNRGVEEQELRCFCACAFELTSLSNGIKVPQYGEGISVQNNALTNDFIYKLLTGPYYVKNYNTVIKKYNDWQDYINFRKYYLDEQTKKSIKFNRCQVLDTYILPKTVFKVNEERYSKILLYEEFARDDQVVITQKVDNAESFPLMQVEIDYNKKTLLAGIEENAKKSREEILLNMFTRQEISLMADKPDDNQRNIEMLQLDDRYKIFSKDIKPDVSDVESEYSEKLRNKKNKIIEKYKSKVEYEVNELLLNKIEELNIELTNRLSLLANNKGKDDSSIEKIKAKLQDENHNKLSIYKVQEEKRLNEKYKYDVDIEIKKIEQELNIEKEKDIKRKVEDETIKRFYIFFKIEEADIELVKNKLEKIKPKFMVYNSVAEETKIKRQEGSLNAFFKGFVKNPYLSKYLFEPSSLAELSGAISDDIEWNLTSLNERQKEAVKKAVASESLFLLQGPPGTGKTQVIAEIISQLVKKGKKILVSSETHKAIDNVFDRLPKIPEIRPLRLIPNANGKESDYSPEKLVDNFYVNITQKIDNQIIKFENFTELKDNFKEEFDNLKLAYVKIQKTSNEINRIKKDIEKLEEIKKQKNDLISEKRKNLLIYENASNNYEYLIKRIENYNISIEEESDFKSNFLAQLNNDLQKIFDEYSIFNIKNLRNIMNVDVLKIQEEIPSFIVNPKLQELETKKANIVRSIQSNLDDDSGEIIDGKEAEVKNLRIQLQEIKKDIEAERKNGVNYSYSDLLMSKIVEPQKLSKNDIDNFMSSLISIREKIQNVINNNVEKLQKERSPITEQIEDINTNIGKIKIDIMQIDDKISANRETQNFIDYNNSMSDLKQKISNFFSNFNIVKDYRDISEALGIIKKEWQELSSNFDKKEDENKTLIPMYKKICKYLRRTDIIENDRVLYTKQLFDNANVFGITCTSRDRFRERDLKSLALYNLGDLDIRTQGIDVVIVDEVSKSSFLDLLIPILYGKTIILVGDHRQLPPMYDLRNLKPSDFLGLDENIINPDINKHYTELYEECFFKTLYEQVPANNKIMLNQQYRCHEDIMRVFNHFYGGKDNKGLMLGYKKQNDEKQHYLNININNKNIIEPDKHIYFVNCDKHDFNDNGSTSIQNPQEANVVCELLDRIDKEYTQMIESDKLKVVVNKERHIDTRPSIGVICTYGDQARLIIRKLRAKIKSFKGFNQLNDSRLIISTVDDFQGDERDIIIVSMVRNPIKRTGNYDFIKKFERINVALSRARKLLIVVGNEDFLSNCGVIDLPDIDGNKALDRHAYPIYREIINTINVYGKILQADDIIKEEK